MLSLDVVNQDARMYTPSVRHPKLRFSKKYVRTINTTQGNQRFRSCNAGEPKVAKLQRLEGKGFGAPTHGS